MFYKFEVIFEVRFLVYMSFGDDVSMVFINLILDEVVIWIEV